MAHVLFNTLKQSLLIYNLLNVPGKNLCLVKMMLAILVTCTRFKISPSESALDIVRDIEERSNTFMKTFDNPIVISYHVSNLIIRV